MISFIPIKFLILRLLRLRYLWSSCQDPRISLAFARKQELALGRPGTRNLLICIPDQLGVSVAHSAVHQTNMSRNWLLVTLMCLSFCIFLTSLIIPIFTFVVPSVAERPFVQQATLTLHLRGKNTAVHFELSDVALPDSAPSLETVIQLCQGSDGVRLRGLAVYSNLTNGCEPIHDVRSEIQVHKIALVTVVNLKPPCTLQDLAVNAKKAGYFALILFGDDVSTGIQFTQKVMIPVVTTAFFYPDIQQENLLIEAGLTEIVLSLPGDTTDLSRMETYFEYIYCWLLVGPSVTLVWLTRKRKLCWMSERRANENENDAETGPRTTEESRETAETEVLHQRPEETSEIHDYSHGDDVQIIPLTSAQTGHTRRLHGTGFVGKIKKYCYRGFVIIFASISYMILIIAALPLGISTPGGGFSFFRFDEVLTYKIPGGIGGWGVSPIVLVAVLLWSTFQMFCFFLYSRFACSTTWVVPTNFSKLIRSEWFASNIYLLVLAAVVPYCSNSASPRSFIYFAIYNTICTVSNLLFIITVNKHKFVTRYVFYISVCMICAYIESDIVAVFYYALNSQGSLNNLKLTALRIVAIGFTLTVSFSSCMHIIRKLAKPTESLFEGLSER